MVKSVINTILKIFVISYTVISIIMIGYSRFEYYKMYKDEIKPMLEQREGNVSETEITKTNEIEFTYVTGFVQGKMREVERNEQIILMSIVIGICGGAVTCFCKNKKSIKANDKK